MKEYMKDYKKIKYILAVVVSSIVIFFSVATLCLPKKDYSENENRHLEEFPEFSFEELKSGQYVQKLERYFTDHFLLRDSLMNMYATVQKTEGVSEINGVYLADDGYLIEKNSEYKNLDKISDNFNQLYKQAKDKNVNMSVMLVPTSITFNESLLPKNAFYYSQQEAIDTIKSKLSEEINFIEPFEKDDNGRFDEKYDMYQMFYKTDHHWTTYGAYFAYENYCKSLNLVPYKMDEYNIKVVSDSFYGTVFSKVNDMSVKPDEIVCFEKDRNLNIMYQGGMSDSLYNESYLDQKDKYSFFLNNINDKIIIENKDVNNGKVLLVAKDSYANCFIPFLTDYYEKIIVLDTRYYMYGVSGLIEKENVTDILLLFNMNTIDTDAAINGIY